MKNILNFKQSKSTHNDDLEAKLDALDKSQAVIEFDIQGNILSANKNFLEAVGYRLDEIQGQHHKIFVDPKEAESAEYKQFWDNLAAGIFQAAEYKRFGKGGEEIWIQASYNPIIDEDGATYKVVKFATDITDQKRQNADYEGQINAIGKSQAVIEFDLTGEIQNANENFLGAVGYSLDEIKGKHHKIFVDPKEAESAEYKQFWDRLAEGQFQAAEYKRFGKGGKEIWIQASYNPIMDTNGKPFKVVKFATDITDQKRQNADYEGQINAIGKSQAVIEFDLTGEIQNANENFLGAVGYSLDEIKGKHHKIFVDPKEAESAEYKQFWDRLAEGQFQAAEYKRFGKGGKEIWIQASYNPIMDTNGKPFKVVKFATDITAQVKAKRNAVSMIESAAVGTEELSTSVKEITESMTKSQSITQYTYSLVENADAQTAKLSDAAEAMGGIVELIDNIAGQINLLALNATIESARAGEAGKGFAVVANEVKSLAAQAKTATDKISDEIGSMRDISDEVVSSLTSIRSSIEEVREYVNSTASAVEEQSAVANEISENMQSVNQEVNNMV